MGTGTPLSPWRIALCAAAMCGIQVCYAAQINLGTSQLLLLGMSERLVSLAWLAGPLSGLLVQPLVGLASDACASPWGRRRPFLVAGAVFTSASLLLFANAKIVAGWLVAEAAVQRVALAVAVTAFFLLDFSIQAVQAPLRALVTDVVPGKQRAVANSWVGVFTGLGNMIGGGLTAVRLGSVFPALGSDAQALFAIAAVVLNVSVAVTVLSTKERPLGRGYEAVDVVNYDGSPGRRPGREGLLQPRRRGVVGVLRGIPRPFWAVFAVQLCTWCGFFTLFVYVNSWVGRNVFLGDGTAKEGSVEREVFERGVRLGGKGNALTAFVTLVYALGLPGLLRAFGVVRVYMFSQVVGAASLLVAPWLRGSVGQGEPAWWLKVVTVADIGVFGVVWATTMGVPWTLVGDALDSDEWYARRIGLFTTLFNASQSFPQLVVAFVAPFILALGGEDPAWVMFGGGVAGVVGVLLLAVLKFEVG